MRATRKKFTQTAKIIEEVLFVPTTNCNLSCPHCITPKTKQVLPVKLAVDFLRECNKAGIKKIGFTGGEPFLTTYFLCELAASAVKYGMAFDRIMTNGVWFGSESHLERVLHRLESAGYDGSICISVDAFHKQNLKKTALFIKRAVSIWDRRDIVSIACVSGAEEKKTERNLRKLASLLDAHFTGFKTGHPLIKNRDLFIRVHKIDLSPVGSAGRLKDPWDGKWFKEDYCKGPGNVFFVMPDGDVKPCCGYANDSKRLTIGNIKRDSVKNIIRNAQKNHLVRAIFNSGLSYIRKKMEETGYKFPGRTSNHCYFCWYLLNKVPSAFLKKSIA